MIRRPRHRVAVKPPFALHFLEGVERFNAAEFWNAHESWEILWLVAETDLDQFLQGLIQLAAAYHHLQAIDQHDKCNPGAAVEHADAANKEDGKAHECSMRAAEHSNK